MNEGDIHITVTMPSAVSLERGAEVLRDMRLALLEFPEVKDVLTEQGHPEDGTDDEAPNQSETFVIMKPHEPSGSTGRTKEQVDRGDARRAGPARRRLQLQPADQGPRRGVDLGHPRPGRREDLRRRPGPDARQAGRGQSDHRTRRAARATSTSTGPAARSTSSPTSIARRRRATACRCATSRTRWRARSAASWRRRCGRGSGGSACASRLPIAGRGRSGRRSGGWRSRPGTARACRWRRWPSVHLDSGRTQINREQGQRFLALKCNIEGRDMGSFVAEAQARVAAAVKLPEGYHLTWGGEFENQRRAMKRLAVIVPISVLRDLLPALPDVPRGAAGAGRAAGRAVRDRGRRVRAVPDAARSCRCRRRSGSSPCSACR